MRVVSLCPSTTELVFELGAGSALVGVTKFCIHPEGGVAKLRKVGGTKNPDLEAIVGLAPDVVLMNQEENRREDAEALARRGVRCVVSFPKTPEECAEHITEIGALLGREERAAELRADLGAALRDARELAPASPVRFAYLIWAKPWMTVNGDTYVSALLGACGGVNVFAERRARYPELTPADLASGGPDAVLLSSEPFPFRPRHRSVLSEATGLAPERFHFVDGELLSWHGSRTARGLRYGSALLRGMRAEAPAATEE